MRTRLTWAQLRRDSGITLTEMLVVMLIMGIVIAATVSLTISVSRTTGQTIARQDQVDAARVAVERISKTTRTAVRPGQLSTGCKDTCATLNAFSQANRTSLQFYANLDNANNSVGPSRVTYSVATSGADAGVLIEKTQRPDYATPDPSGYVYCDAEVSSASAKCRSQLTVRRVATGVQTTGSLFRFYDVDGTVMTPPASGLTAANLERIVAIEVTVTVQSDSPTAPRPTTYIQRITLPNAQAAIQAGEDATP